MIAELQTAIDASITAHTEWLTAFRKHMACLDEYRWIDSNDLAGLAEWEAREAALAARADETGARLDALGAVA